MMHIIAAFIRLCSSTFTLAPTQNTALCLSAKRRKCAASELACVRAMCSPDKSAIKMMCCWAGSSEVICLVRAFTINIYKRRSALGVIGGVYLRAGPTLPPDTLQMGRGPGGQGHDPQTPIGPHKSANYIEWLRARGE